MKPLSHSLHCGPRYDCSKRSLEKEFLNKPIGPAIERVMEERRSVPMNNPGENAGNKDCAIIESDSEEEGM